MQTVYTVHPDIAIEGMPVGGGFDRDTQPLALPYLAQVSTIVIADASPAPGEAWSVQITDDETGYVFPVVDFLSGASLAATLDNLVTAWAISGKANDLFTITEDGVDTATLTARQANREYTIVTAAGGSATATDAITTTAGGSGLEFGRVVAYGSAEGEMRAVQSGDAVANIAGVLFRTDANHFHSLENDTPSAVDASERGKSYPIMQRGRFWAKAEDAVTAGGSIFARMTGSGRLGGFRSDNDGGNAIDVSSIARFETSAAADGLVRVSFHKLP